MKLSIVIPVYNEEKNILSLHMRLTKVLKKITSSYEIIFVNDGSVDNSLNKILALRKKNKKVKIINFSRNFGHMSAITAGLRSTSGKKVVIMDADLQDPPEVIPKLYEKSSNYDVVYAIKRNRKEGLFMKASFSLFYEIQKRVADLPIPANAGTFSIVDKKVIKIISDLPEKNKFFSGLRVWAGFTQGEVDYERAARNAGKRKSLGSLVKMALDGIFSFSYVPLRLASFLGIILSILSLMLIIVVVSLRIAGLFPISGWASAVTLILFIGSVQLITLGIIGEYLARIYEEVKNRPEYIVTQKIGFTKSK